jgi:redox-sensitive bicupin YhaK (pirin superfamily)
MIKKIYHKKMGRSTSLSWLDSHFHFSFAEYYHPDHIQFGMLRVINDDLIQPAGGFGRHPHRDMEIVSYIVDGALTHADSMGNREVVTRGQVQYMSAGTGITHSEENFGKEVVRLFKIWILQDRVVLTPNYGDFRFEWDHRIYQWLHLVSGQGGEAPSKIYQDFNIQVSWLEKGKAADYQVAPNRQAYLVQIEGRAIVNGEPLVARDGLTSVEEDLSIQAEEDSHLIVFEMAKA